MLIPCFLLKQGNNARIRNVLLLNVYSCLKKQNKTFFAPTQYIYKYQHVTNASLEEHGHDFLAVFGIKSFYAQVVHRIDYLMFLSPFNFQGHRSQSTASVQPFQPHLLCYFCQVIRLKQQFINLKKGRIKKDTRTKHKHLPSAIFLLLASRKSKLLRLFLYSSMTPGLSALVHTKMHCLCCNVIGTEHISSVA